MPKRKEPTTYVEYIQNIIHYDTSSSVEVKNDSKKTFEEWDKKYKNLFKEAPFWRIWYRRWMISRRKHYVFNWRSSRTVPEGGEPVFVSAFTSEFPSLHDMPEWALSTRMADLMMLKGISVEESNQYCLVVKNHFVNHKMVRGVIEFDLYKLNP